MKPLFIRIAPRIAPVRAFAVLLFSLLLAAAGVRAAQPVVLSVGVPKAPPALPVLRMIETRALGDDVDLRLVVWTAPEQLIAMAQRNDPMMYALPLTVASKLYNKGVGIVMTNVNTWDAASLLSSDPAVRGWGDLKGRTLFVPLKSSTPDALTRFFLARAGLEAGRDVTITYSAAVEIAQLLKAGKIAHGVTIEPQVSTILADAGPLHVVANFSDEWEAVMGAGRHVPNAGMGASKALVDADPRLVARFELEYEKALAWVNANPAAAARLAEDRLGLRAAALERAMPRLGLRYVKASEAEPDIRAFFTVLGELSADLFGKNIPDEAFYWQ